MRRLIMMVAAMGLVIMAATGAFAQIPADPNNTNEKVPETMNPAEYGQSIDIATAKKVAAAAFAELAKRNWHGMCVSVVDTHGDLVYFERDDRSQYAAINISQRKARVGDPWPPLSRLCAIGRQSGIVRDLSGATGPCRGGKFASCLILNFRAEWQSAVLSWWRDSSCNISRRAVDGL